MKTLLVGTLDSFSNGDMAIATTLVRLLHERDSEISLTLQFTSPETVYDLYREFLTQHNVKLRRIPWFRQRSSRKLTILSSILPAIDFLLRGKRFMAGNSVYLDFSTDTFTDYYGTLSLYAKLAQPFLCSLWNVPYAVCGITAGPFRSRLATMMARRVLTKARFVTVRDEASRDLLAKMGIRSVKVADLAFLLQPSSDLLIPLAGWQEHAPSKQLVVGIAANSYRWSHALGRGFKSAEADAAYVKCMANIVDHIVEGHDASVLLIAHATGPTADDRGVHQQIAGVVKHRDRVRIIEDRYRTDQLKAYISSCDVFIACRMHAAIAAVSTHVPTIAIAWSDKFRGVLGSYLDADGCLIDIRRLSPEDFESEVCRRVDDAIVRREELTEHLRRRMAEARREAALNVEMITDLLRPQKARPELQEALEKN